MLTTKTGVIMSLLGATIAGKGTLLMQPSHQIVIQFSYLPSHSSRISAE